MAFDGRRGVVVLYGGYTVQSAPGGGFNVLSSLSFNAQGTAAFRGTSISSRAGGANAGQIFIPDFSGSPLPPLLQTIS